MDHTVEELTEYFEYLDGLRESGATNMFGARPYLEGTFPELTEKEAGTVLTAWMTSFDDAKTPFERANEVLES